MNELSTIKAKWHGNHLLSTSTHMYSFAVILRTLYFAFLLCSFHFKTGYLSDTSLIFSLYLSPHFKTTFNLTLYFLLEWVVLKCRDPQLSQQEVPHLGRTWVFSYHGYSTTSLFPLIGNILNPLAGKLSKDTPKGEIRCEKKVGP